MEQAVQNRGDKATVQLAVDWLAVVSVIVDAVGCDQQGLRFHLRFVCQIERQTYRRLQFSLHAIGKGQSRLPPAAPWPERQRVSRC